MEKRREVEKPSATSVMNFNDMMNQLHWYRCMRGIIRLSPLLSLIFVTVQPSTRLTYNFEPSTHIIRIVSKAPAHLNDHNHNHNRDCDPQPHNIEPQTPSSSSSRLPYTQTERRGLYTTELLTTTVDRGSGFLRFFFIFTELT